MKVTTSWIQSYLRRTISDREIVDALERAGIEVEQFSSSKALDEQIVIAEVRSVSKHPEADRLNVCEVWDGKDTYEVVCGAPNVRAGIIVPFARTGSILPSGDMITQAKLRGVTSNGMLCSGRELELSEDHAGLLELDASAKLGAPINSLYPADGLIHMKTAANRWDVLSVLGLAREVSGQLETGLEKSVTTELLFDSKTSYIASLELSVLRFCVAELTVDGTASTPEWMAQRLTAAGVRTINVLVDITNYVMLEHGQPMHAYEADVVTLPFSVRAAQPNEPFTTLDDVPRSLHAEDLVVADASRALGLAGVMGGVDSEVSNSTKRIYLEAATFAGAAVRKSAKRHNLRSEASARFERGLPVQLAPVAMARAVELLIEYANAKLIGAQDMLNSFAFEYRVGIRTNYAANYLGVELDRKGIVDTLGRLEIEATPFDIVSEARKHLDKPYEWGASFRKNRDAAFDCSYFTDYLYSLIGLEIGHTSLGQYEVGRPIADDELKPGDILFYRGKDSGDSGDYELEDIQSEDSNAQPHSIKGHYYMRDHKNGGYQKIEANTDGLVGHNGIYVGDGKVIHAAHYEYVDGDWKELGRPRVMESLVEQFTLNPTYLGARRYVEDLDDWVSVAKVPWWRSDIRLEEDLLEELARVIGYDNIPSTIPAWHPQTVTFDRATQPTRRIRQLLSGLGLYEIMTYSFVSGEQIERVGEKTAEHLKLQNPLSSEQEYLRRTLVPSHLSVLEQNRKVAKEVGFYEISGVFHDRGKDLPFEPMMLGVTVAVPGEAYRYVKGIWDQLQRHLGLEAQIMIKNEAPFAAGRSAQIIVRGVSIGTIGQIAPRIVRAHKLEGEVARLEINLAAALVAAQTVFYDAPSKYPAAHRDLTVLVPLGVEWQKVSKTIGSIAGVQYGGDYYGDELPDGYRALSMRLAFAADDHTLTDDEVTTLLEKVEHTLANKFKAKPRS